jgi:DNA-binding MarR family transcriptional regulator
MTDAATRSALAETADAPDIETEYMRSLQLVERLHRQMLDVIKDDLERHGRDDINSVQALLIYNIGGDEMSAGELMSRGHYLGSNVSYNLKKLVELGYIHHSRSETDKRAVRVSLTNSGRAVHIRLSNLFQKHVRTLEPVGAVRAEDLSLTNRTLMRLERFWSDQIRYRM